MKPIFILIALCSGFSVAAQKAKDYSVVVEEWAQKLETSQTSDRSVRLAVVPLANTQSTSSNKFGEYFTESLIGRLSDKPGKFKIFERKRLDAILKEDELMLSDLMLPEAAQKMGKLAPIDALSSGTYTKLKTYVDVSARLIDVASGEIIASFSGRIKLSKNLKILFAGSDAEQLKESITVVRNTEPVNENPKSEVVISKGKSREEICNELFRDFKPKLNDLSTKERVDAVVKEAMRTPFENACGKLHYELMYSIKRFRLNTPDYEMFLISTLDTIRYPSEDDRAYEIIRFVTNDSTVDGKEWKSGLNMLTKIGDYSLSNYITYLLAKTKSTTQESEERIDTFFKLASAGKIGLPKPITFNPAFFEMMEGVRYNQALRKYVYQKYASLVTADVKSASSLYSILHAMYKEETIQAEKTKMISWVADFFNNYSDEKSHEHLFDMAWSFNLTLNDTRNKEIKAEFPEADLKILVDRCRNKFSEYAMKTPYPNQQEDRINFCVKYGIPIRGIIPSLSEADAILKGNDVNEQLRVMKLLDLMGSQPKSLEPSLINLFSKRSLEEKEKMTEIQSLSMAVLGHIKTTDSKAIDYMVSKLMSYNYQESDNAVTALVNIGKSAVAPLVKTLNSTTDQDGGLRYKMIVILGKIGQGAKAAEPTLKKLLAENRNADVRYAIEAALQSIQ
jgi:TolB-like protein